MLYRAAKTVLITESSVCMSKIKRVWGWGVYSVFALHVRNNIQLTAQFTARQRAHEGRQDGEHHWTKWMHGWWESVGCSNGMWSFVAANVQTPMLTSHPHALTTSTLHNHISIAAAVVFCFFFVFLHLTTRRRLSQWEAVLSRASI